MARIPKLVLRRRGRRLGGSLLVLVLAVLAVLGLSAGTANAATGTALPPGSSVCTDYLRSDGGAYLRGINYTFDPVTWSVRMSSSPGGAESVVLETTDWEVLERAVPEKPGSFYFRNCVTNTSGTTANFRLHVSQGPGATSYEYGIGPHTATLAPGGAFCGEWAVGAAHFSGTSDVPVQWHVRALDGDTLEETADLYTVTAASAAQTVTAPAPGDPIETCVTNTSASTATLSFQLT